MNAFQRRGIVIAAVLCGLFSLSGGAARAGLIAVCSFNGTLADSSGNGKTATNTGSPQYVDGAPFGGQAISFDGTGDVSVTAPP
jgi:hypothetical protein